MSDTSISIKFGGDITGFVGAIDKAKESLATMHSSTNAAKATFDGLNASMGGASKTLADMSSVFDRVQSASTALSSKLDQLRAVQANLVSQFQAGQSSSLTGLLSQVQAAGTLQNFVALSGGLAGLTAIALGLASAEVNLYDTLQKTADEARLSVSQFSGLQSVFGRFGFSADQTSKSLISLADNLLEAKAHGGELASTLQMAGIAFQSADGSLRPTIEVLQDIVTHMQNTSDAEANLKLATAAVGGQMAGDFVAAVNKGGSALANLQSATSVATSSIQNDFAAMSHSIVGILDALWTRVNSFYSRLKELTGSPLSGADNINVASEHLTEAIGHLNQLQVRSGSDIFAPPSDQEMKDAWQRVFDAGKEIAEKNPIPVLAGGDPREALKPTPPAAPVVPAPSTPSRSASSSDDEDTDKSMAVIEQLREQLALAQSIGDAHQAIVDKIKTEAELKKAGVSADSEEGQQIAALVTHIDAANAALAQQRQISAQVKEAFDQVGESISGSLMQMIQGQATMRDLARNVMLSIIQYAIQSRVKMVADWAAGEASKLGFTVAGESARTAATEAGEASRTGIISAASIEQAAVQGLAMIKSILASAAQTFAGIFGFLSPEMGPLAAGPAAAGQAAVAAMTALVPHETGAWELPDTHAALVHKGEMIIPAGQASVLRAAMPGGTVATIGDTLAAARSTMARFNTRYTLGPDIAARMPLIGGSTFSESASSVGGIQPYPPPSAAGGHSTPSQQPITFNVSAVDAKSFVGMLNNNKSDLMKAIRDALKKGM